MKNTRRKCDRSIFRTLKVKTQNSEIRCTYFQRKYVMQYRKRLDINLDVVRRVLK